MKLRGIAGATVAVLLALLSSEAGHAAGIRCRSDPAVVLSNGAVVDLSADIDANLWDVQAVEYSLRIPAGVAVIAVVRTPDWPTTKETFRVVADRPRGVYDTTTTVRTSQCGSAVTVNLLVQTMTNLLGYRTQDGFSGDAIRLGITAR